MASSEADLSSTQRRNRGDYSVVGTLPVQARLSPLTMFQESSELEAPSLPERRRRASLVSLHVSLPDQEALRRRRSSLL